MYACVIRTSRYTRVSLGGDMSKVVQTRRRDFICSPPQVHIVRIGISSETGIYTRKGKTVRGAHLAMLDSLLKLVEYLIKFREHRDADARVYFDRYIQPTYVLAIEVYEDYLRIFQQVRDLVGSGADL